MCGNLIPIVILTNLLCFVAGVLVAVLLIKLTGEDE